MRPTLNYIFVYVQGRLAEPAGVELDPGPTFKKSGSDLIKFTMDFFFE